MAKTSVVTWDPTRLREIRGDRGWTVERMAVATDTGVAAMRGYLDGSTAPSPKALVRLATALEVATTDLAPLRQPPRMHELRWHQGKTASDVARDVGAGTGLVGSILRGATAIPEGQARAWAEALGTDVDTLAAAWAATRADLTRGD